MVSAEKSLALAPATTSDDLRLCQVKDPLTHVALAGSCFGHEVGPVGDKLRIHTVNTLQRAFQLAGRVVLRLQPTNRRVDQLAQKGNVRRDR